MTKTGIDAIHYYVPSLVLPISALAEARGIEYAKLNKGLGLEGMALCDADEDVATMAAEAAINLIEEQGLEPQEIDRIYLGTESALDAAKPTAAYILGIIEDRLQSEYGERCLQNCDVIDMTFACIGGVDALLNSADYIRLHPQSKAIVIAADKAQYDLASTGEYTQGAGAVAMLISANPRLLSLEPVFGVATKSEYDFFKPRRLFAKSELLQAAAQLLGSPIKEEDISALLASAEDAFWGSDKKEIELFKEEPVFDGPYSNDCYKARTSEALAHLEKQRPELSILKDWDYTVFHLPYAYQARRMFTEMWLDRLSSSELASLVDELGQASGESPNWDPAFVKAVSKSDAYRQFVAAKIAPGERASSQIGNMYTASLFMSFLSILESAREVKEDLAGKQMGFMAYGSGSKSKVFFGSLEAQWQEALPKGALFSRLAQRQTIDFKTYEALHKGELKEAVLSRKGSVFQALAQEPNREGYRYYAQASK